MANWCKNDIQFLGSAERVETLIRGWKTHVERDDRGDDVLPLPCPPGMRDRVRRWCLDRVVFGPRRVSGDTKWEPPLDWLIALTRDHPVAAVLAYTDEYDGAGHHLLIVGGRASPLYTVRTVWDGGTEVCPHGDAGRKCLLPDPLPSPEFEAGESGVQARDVVRRRDEVANEMIRWVNEDIARDGLGAPLSPTATNRRRVNEIFHQQGFRSPSLIRERLDQFEREEAVPAG
jgi:hypothetical protein